MNSSMFSNMDEVTVKWRGSLNESSVNAITSNDTVTMEAPGEGNMLANVPMIVREVTSFKKSCVSVASASRDVSEMESEFNNQRLVLLPDPNSMKKKVPSVLWISLGISVGRTLGFMVGMMLDSELGSRLVNKDGRAVWISDG